MPNDFADNRVFLLTFKPIKAKTKEEKRNDYKKQMRIMRRASQPVCRGIQAGCSLSLAERMAPICFNLCLLFKKYRTGLRTRDRNVNFL